MTHSNFKERSHENSTGVGSHRDMKLKLRLHLRYCKNPPKGTHKIVVPKKATTFREHQINSSLRRRGDYI